MSTQWFYSAPHEDVLVRRGDPLGMRGTAERLAERLAPGLSNRTVDARWITILCWALGRAEEAADLYGPQEGLSKAGVPGYPWLRPLELLCVARAIDLGVSDGRQLPGVRSVRRWLDDEKRTVRLGFSKDSYDRYRFTGAYGAYRSTLRSLPGLTMRGDGWRLDEKGRELAKIQKTFGRGGLRRLQIRRGKAPKPEVFWTRNFNWRKVEEGALPTVLSVPKALPRGEREVLRELLFSRKDPNGSVRRLTARVAAGSGASTRSGIFADVAKRRGTESGLGLLEPFSSLADAAMSAMNSAWGVVRSGASGNGGFVTLEQVLAEPIVGRSLLELAGAAARWEKATKKLAAGEYNAANALAATVQRAKKRDYRGIFVGLERHHQEFGGGLKWLALQNRRVIPLAQTLGGAGSYYRFRDEALLRIAVQCGVNRSLPLPYRKNWNDESEGGA